MRPCSSARAPSARRPARAAPMSSCSSKASISRSPWTPWQDHSHSGQRRQTRQCVRSPACSQRVGWTRPERHSGQTCSSSTGFGLLRLGSAHASPIEPERRALDPQFLERPRENPTTEYLKAQVEADPAAQRPRYHGSMPGNIGPLEIIIVLIIALVVFGPKRLPELGSSLGRGIREFRSTVTGDKTTMRTTTRPRRSRRGCSAAPVEPPAKSEVVPTNTAEARRDAPPRQGGLP